MTSPSKLGPVQRTVIHLLALKPRRVRTIVDDGFGISDHSARSALQSLGLRGLVDRRFEDGKLTYFLTPKGQQVADLMIDLDEDES